MTKNPEITFDTIKEFKNYYKKHKNVLIPLIQYNSKKHQNPKGEYLHEIFGEFILCIPQYEFKINFTINEMIGFKDKFKPQEDGYKIGTLK
jgi:hypothetical protein